MNRPSKVYQILIMLLYVEHKSMNRLGDGEIEIKTSLLAESLSVRNEKIRDCFRWLKKNFFLETLELYSGSIRCKVRLPKKILAEHGIEIGDLYEQV